MDRGGVHARACDVFDGQRLVNVGILEHVSDVLDRLGEKPLVHHVDKARNFLPKYSVVRFCVAALLCKSQDDVK